MFEPQLEGQLDLGEAPVRVGQRWRQTDGYLCDVVGFAANGWPWVRHPNAKSGGHMVNPAWFAHWELVRDG